MRTVRCLRNNRRIANAVRTVVHTVALVMTSASKRYYRVHEDFNKTRRNWHASELQTL